MAHVYIGFGADPQEAYANALERMKSDRSISDYSYFEEILIDSYPTGPAITYSAKLYGRASD